LIEISTRFYFIYPIHFNKSFYLNIHDSLN
jgi:hypothetical protein